MTTCSLAIVVGSLRQDSMNRKLAHGLAKLLPADVQVQYVEIGALPLYNQDSDDQPPAPAVKQFRDAIAGSNAVLFVTPEYNRSIPGPLKNALDTGSRPFGKSVWNHKPAGIIGMSPGAIGTALCQQHLRNVLAYLNMPTLEQPEAYLQFKDGFFNADGSIGEHSAAFLTKWVKAFMDHVRQHGQPTQPAQAGAQS